MSKKTHKPEVVTVEDINTLCLEFGWSFRDKEKFKLAWDLLKLARMDEDILITYINILL